MLHARDLMEPARTVSPELSIPGLARRLLELEVDGVCVVDAGDRLVGVVTAMDLVFREREIHPPVTIAILDLVLQLGRGRTERELAKIAAVSVSELMTRDVVTVGPDTPLPEVASRMVDQHLSLVPVVDGGSLVGVVTKRAIVLGALRRLVQDPAGD